MLDDVTAGEKLTRPIKERSEKYKLIPEFFKVRGLLKQHIDSFNYLLDKEIRDIVLTPSNQKLTVASDPNFYLKYLNVFVGKPSIEEDFRSVAVTPQECRLKDITYSAPITVDIEFVRGKEIVVKKGKKNEGAIPIGKIPIMLRSNKCVLYDKSEQELIRLGECPLDPGGYFVVKGTEKVILIQENVAKNRIIIECDSHNDVKAIIQSYTHEKKTLTNVVTKNDKFYLRVNVFGEDINIAVILKAMGVSSDQEIVQLIGQEHAIISFILPTLYECKALKIFTEQQAQDYLASKIKVNRGGQGFQGERQNYGDSNIPREHEAREVLSNVVLTHIPMPNFSFADRVIYMGYILRRMIAVRIDNSLVDDRDFYGNKRLELAGQLMSLLFEDVFKKLNWDLRKQAERKLCKNQKGNDFDISRCIRQDIITSGIELALSTGHWSIKRYRTDKKGVTQVLSRFSFIATVGMMTRITSSLEKSRKVSGPRSIHGSQWGVICPCDTPEGESCGLTKNLALLSHITTEDEEQPIINVAFALGVEPMQMVVGVDRFKNKAAIVFLNGFILGMHRRPIGFLRQFRHLRRNGYIKEFVSISMQDDRIVITSDSGRICRPLIICDGAVPRLKNSHIRALEKGEMKLSSFIEQGLVEYLDVNEEDNSAIALYEDECFEQTTHLEIEPLSILGIVAGLIPYPHHNQSPRNTYQCAMGKQAMGSIAYNQDLRMDSLLYLLSYPQKPLLTTHTIELVGFDKLGAGQNAVVAVMSYSGYDLEDSTVMNKGSLDRGFGRSVVLKKYGTKLKLHLNRTMDQISGPPKTEEAKKREGKWRCIESDGLPAVGDKIHPGEIYINKYISKNTRNIVSNPNSIPPTAYAHRPEFFKGPVGVQDVCVDRVLITETGDCPYNIKVLMRQMRTPEIGDKFSSRHGQKGVLGYICKTEDLPFSELGIIPDIIMNPHGFPSRMTVGKLFELVGSKTAALKGRVNYGTAFGERSGLATPIEEIKETLSSYGFHCSGKDYLTSGITGEPIEAYIFMGPVYYQRLKHMVQDKMHARAKGPRMVLTRQPTEGRSRDGGLRVGEMERDCLIAYGTSNLLVERLMISSDKFEVYVDKKSGMIGHFCAKRNAAVSPIDNLSTNMVKIEMPYACKLLFQELQAMNIMPRLALTDL